MKRTLILALATSVGVAACSDEAMLPVETDLRPEEALSPGTNPLPGTFTSPAPLDLSRLDFSRPAFSDAPAGGGLSPATLTASMRAGETVTEDKQVTLPASPPMGDVVFSFDLTSSMQGALSNVRSNAVDIMNEVAGVIPDVQFGVISYMDYPAVYVNPPVAGNCGYGPSYGVQYGIAAYGDYPYRMDRSVTGDRASVVAALGGLRLGFGGDIPESYSRAFYETYADADIAWRPGARRIVVNFGDAQPHDCDYDAVVGGGQDTGADPGRDGVIGTADDLRILEVLDEMKANDITLINLFNGPTTYQGVNLVALWEAYAERTGGTSFRTNTNGTIPGGADVADAIADLILSTVSTVNLVTLRACSEDGAYASWVREVSPASYTGVALPQEGVETLDFDLTVGPPAGTAPGDYSFDVCAVGDGAEYGRQSVSITVLPDNHPPVADAGADQDVLSLTDVTLDGSASADPDGDALSYAWTDADGTVVGTAAAVSLPGLAKGSHVFTLTVSDPEGLSDSDEVTVVVRNRAPVADAGEGATLEAASFAGAGVTLDGSASADADGTLADFAWFEGSARVASGATPTVTLALGSHVLRLVVTDDDGATAEDEVVVKVVDTTAPDLSLTASPGSLWPPNGKYHAISVGVSASDVADAAVAVEGYVVSSEPDDANGNGDGATTADVRVIRPDGTVLESSNAAPRVAFRPGDRLEVRAERAGSGAGRAYRVVLTATDASGNATEASATVSVAHDKGK